MFKITKSRVLLLFLLLIVLLIGCGNRDSNEVTDNQNQRSKKISSQTKENPPDSIFNSETVEAASLETSDESAPTSSSMTVHFLDVGQGLSVFVQSGGQNLIYDGGDKSASSYVVAYLKEQGVTQIDYLISSHYDSDHLAGLIGCLNAFTVHNVIGSNYEHNSKLYSSFMNTVSDQHLEMQYPAVGTEFTFGTGKFTILSPESITDNSNANSVVIKLQNGDNSFLLTGDADHKAETAMCNSWLDLDCDVLSISHHGSATATSYDFLAQTLPDVAIVSSGLNNQYGHPDKDTLDKLQDMEIDLYRTDNQGLIIAQSDGKNITWNQEPGNDYSPGDHTDTGTQPQKAVKETPAETPTPYVDTHEDISSEEMVWRSATGEKYHNIPNCGRMNPNNAVELTQEQAQSLGLDQCSKCF